MSPSRARSGPLQAASPDTEAVPFEDSSDAALVIAIGRWHDEALAEVFGRHSRAMLALARRVLRDDALAEDVVQEIFVRLWDDPARFDPARGELRTFLLTGCHGRCVDLVRSNEARRKREDRVAARGAAGGAGGPEDVLVDLTVAEEVRDALGQLPAPERAAISLAFFEGHTYCEVAALLEEPEGTIKTRIRSGLLHLRPHLDGVRPV